MKLIEKFDPATLCCSLAEGGLAVIVTDFRQDAAGLTQILVLDKGMSPQRTGALAQRLFDIEIYRTLAMLGLPLAQRLSPRMRKAEDQLAALTNRMRSIDADDADDLLDDITALAADLEADAASSLYRFGASRAYDEIVDDRLDALAEEPVTGYDTWRGFLERRVAPAMRTCRSVEDRLANLSRKLARAATLLRTKVDVAVEKQNRDLLHSMNKRAKLQLRLQQTVEGLSVAAVSYYVVGLIAYLVKGIDPKRFGIPTPRHRAGRSGRRAGDLGRGAPHPPLAQRQRALSGGISETAAVSHGAAGAFPARSPSARFRPVLHPNRERCHRGRPGSR
jgi:uncharacterized membrane-anchored protein